MCHFSFNATQYLEKHVNILLFYVYYFYTIIVNIVRKIKKFLHKNILFQNCFVKKKDINEIDLNFTAFLNESIKSKYLPIYLYHKK